MCISHIATESSHLLPSSWHSKKRRSFGAVLLLNFQILICNYNQIRMEHHTRLSQLTICLLIIVFDLWVLSVLWSFSSLAANCLLVSGFSLVTQKLRNYYYRHYRLKALVLWTNNSCSTFDLDFLIVRNGFCHGRGRRKPYWCFQTEGNVEEHAYGVFNR